MNILNRTALGAAMVAALLAGCAQQSSRVEPTFEMAAQNAFIPTNRAAAASLLAQIKGNVYPDRPIIAATVVDVNKLEKSSTLGRMITEQVSAVFSNAGFRMVEMKFRSNVYIKQNEGEFMLTREIAEVARQHNAQAVVVGTYGVASDMVYLNLKVIAPGSNAILAAHDYALPLDRNMRAMLTATQ